MPILSGKMCGTRLSISLLAQAIIYAYDPIRVKRLLGAPRSELVAWPGLIR